MQLNLFLFMASISETEDLFFSRTNLLEGNVIVPPRLADVLQRTDVSYLYLQF